MPTPTSTPWDHLYNDVKTAIPGVTDAVLKQEFFQVVKDFTDMTNIWTEEVPIPVQPNVRTYNFTVADQGTPNRLVMLYDAAAQNPDKKWVSTAVMMDKPGQITIGFSPSTAATWNAIVAKTPLTVSSDGWPDLGAGIWIVDKYREGLMYGTIGRLQLLPAKSFSNPKLGAENRQQYISQRSKARGDVMKSNVFGGQRWQYPQSWSTPHRGGWV